MDRSWQEFVGTIGIFTLLIVVVVVAITQIAAIRREKARIAREVEYRKIADEGLASLRGMERTLTELTGQLTEMRARVDSVERILQQVE
ncbi:hypothetical protein [Amycolatopsis sp. CA-230715]|uniref:hypothetical protein n=1 Tax=Amycolatopsis sp. CA-230715 TaxID=2745196 RepID=UPI001C00A939|nr:hypothetical protein [Amycolatopsis sp. CA-230715]QWF78176.1 hypothetical protein HUW46_01571 [Amycolatopsis sp. CA-230715]